MHSEEKLKISWVHTLFFIITPILATIGSIWWFTNGYFNWNTVILAVIFFILVEISITAGYHRLFSHRAYKAHPILRLFVAFFGGGAFEGPILHWCLDHRNHHKYVDDYHKDPYSISKGFWWAHIGWIFYRYDYESQEIEAKDLYDDKIVMWQKENYVVVASFFAFILPALIACLWGDFLGGFIIAGLVKLVFAHHATFLINSLSHCVGSQPYSDKHSSRDNWFTALLTFGEGYHNYHHEFPSDYRNGVRFYQWDPSKWSIYLLSKLGLASNLVRIPEELIIKKRLRMLEKTLEKKMAKRSQSPSMSGIAHRAIRRLTCRVEKSARQLTELRGQLSKLKLESANQDLIKEIKEQVNSARNEFYRQVALWRAMNKRVLVKVH